MLTNYKRSLWLQSEKSYIFLCFWPRSIICDTVRVEYMVAVVIMRKGIKLKIWGPKRIRAENVHGNKT